MRSTDGPTTAGTSGSLSTQAVPRGTTDMDSAEEDVAVVGAEGVDPGAVAAVGVPGAGAATGGGAGTGGAGAGTGEAGAGTGGAGTGVDPGADLGTGAGPTRRASPAEDPDGSDVTIFLEVHPTT